MLSNGNRSLVLVGVTGFIIGLVMTLQSRPTLIQFGAVSWMPNMTGISIVREIGPVITALICAGRIASGIGAELGSMRVTEQIDAMEVSGTNPFKYLVVTRILATTLMLPLLVRNWKTGDRFQPFGMKGEKKISDYFIDLKLNNWEKHNQLIVEDAAGKIIWIVGKRTSDLVKVTPVTKKNSFYRNKIVVCHVKGAF